MFYLSEFNNLKRIEFNCDNGFNEECAAKAANLPNLRIVFFGCNFHRHMAYLDEKQTFQEFNTKERQSSIALGGLEKLMSLKNL